MVSLFRRFFQPVFLFNGGLILIALGLPLSKVLMSVGQFMMAAGWLLDGNYKSKIQAYLQSRESMALLGLWVLHLLFLANSNNHSYAWNDIRIKLPLLVIPLLVAGFQPLNKEIVHRVLHALLFSLFAGTVVGLYLWSGINGEQLTDSRRLSPFISHIRFSLLLVLGEVVIYYLWHKNRQERYAFWYLVLAFWFLLFLFMLQSLSGLVILFVLIYVISIKKILCRKESYRFVLLFLLFLPPGYIVYQSYTAYRNFERPKPMDLSSLPTHTSSGRLYYYDVGNDMLENGNRLWYFINEEELSKEWLRKFGNQLDTLIDEKANPMKYTLMRYMTSKDLKKDSVGFNSLTHEDLTAIKKGVTNYKYVNPLSLEAKVYEVFWQAHAYSETGYASGQSLSMRLEFLKTGWKILIRRPLTGTGTGDVMDEFQWQYDEEVSRLENKFRLRAHNQYFTFLISFGIPAGCLALYYLFYPLYSAFNRKNNLFLGFYFIALMSMFNEDTLETQAGITFFTFFFSLFLFYKLSDKQAPPTGRIASL